MAIRIPVYRPYLQGNETAYVTDCMASTWISSRGEYIDRFEQGMCALTGAQHAVSVFNGSVALHLALECLGIGAGDEVIVPTFTYIASVNAIAMTGATPVFVESSPENLVDGSRGCAREKSRHAPKPSCQCTCTASPATWTRLRQSPANTI